MLAEIQMEQAIMNLLQEPKNITIIQLKELSNRIRTAVDERERGSIYAASFDIEIARQQVIRCLSEIVKMDVVSKKQYEQTKGDLDRCSKELGKMRTEVTQLQPLGKEVTKRDEAVQILSESLFPIDQRLKGNWIIACPRCHVGTIFVPETKDSKSLLQSGYIAFECQPCGQKTNLTLKDLYQNILQHGYFGIRM